MTSVRRFSRAFVLRPGGRSDAPLPGPALVAALALISGIALVSTPDPVSADRLASGGAGSPPVATDRLASGGAKSPPVATFSFVAQDTSAGISGVVVASKFFAVGSVVPWGQGDVGAVATQAFCNTTFGPRGLALLAAGATPEQALEVMLQDDPGRESRQVGIVDARGRSATHTGSECMAWAGGRSAPKPPPGRCSMRLVGDQLKRPGGPRIDGSV